MNTLGIRPPGGGAGTVIIGIALSADLTAEALEVDQDQAASANIDTVALTASVDQAMTAEVNQPETTAEV